MEEMFAFNSAEIDLFRNKYLAADNTPFLVQEDTLSDLSVGVDDLGELGVRIAPNPVMDGVLNVVGLDDRITGADVYDMAGKLIAQRGASGDRQWRVTLPPGRGTYLVAIHTRERTFVQRVVSLR
jgi:hypothetical protein